MHFKCLTLALLLLTVSPLVAQETSAPATVAQMKETARRFKNSRRFKISYDKFKDITTVTAGAFGVDGVELSAFVSFRGEALREPITQAIFKFAVTSTRGWRFLESHDLYIIADGQRLETGAALYNGKAGYGFVDEWVTVPVAFDTFQKIANAGTVEMRLGRRELKIRGEHLQAFRDLSSLIATSKN